LVDLVTQTQHEVTWIFLSFWMVDTQCVVQRTVSMYIFIVWNRYLVLLEICVVRRSCTRVLQVPSLQELYPSEHACRTKRRDQVIVLLSRLLMECCGVRIAVRICSRGPITDTKPFFFSVKSSWSLPSKMRPSRIRTSSLAMLCPQVSLAALIVSPSNWDFALSCFSRTVQVHELSVGRSRQATAPENSGKRLR